MAETQQHIYFTQHIRTDLDRAELQRRYDTLKAAGLDSAAKSIAEQLARMSAPR